MAAENTNQIAKAFDQAFRYATFCGNITNQSVDLRQHLAELVIDRDQYQGQSAHIYNGTKVLSIHSMLGTSHFYMSEEGEPSLVSVFPPELVAVLNSVDYGSYFTRYMVFNNIYEVLPLIGQRNASDSLRTKGNIGQRINGLLELAGEHTPMLLLEEMG